jgi:hypothetical protein
VLEHIECYKNENPFTVYSVIKKKCDCKENFTVGSDILTSLKLNCFQTLTTRGPWPENGPKRQGKRGKT